jgi:hypothetical protein
MKSRMIRTGIVAAKKVKKKIKNFVTANPKKTIVGVGLGAIYGHSKTPMARQSQNQRIEMQAIAKERKVRKISRSEINTRLAKAKKSKREFTWI